MAEKSDAPCRQRQNKDTILMVDDNPANLQVLQAILEGQGCRLLTARDGASALSVAAKEKPDVILLDIDQLLDRLRLITGRSVLADDFKRPHGVWPPIWRSSNESISSSISEPARRSKPGNGPGCRTIANRPLRP